MKHLKKFNEGFMDIFKKKKKDSKKLIKVGNSKYYLEEVDGKSHIYDDNDRFIALLDTNKLILTLYKTDYSGPVPAQIADKRIKVKSVDQALNYIDKLENEKSNSFDEDISDE